MVVRQISGRTLRNKEEEEEDRLGPFLGVQNLEFQYWGFSENRIDLKIKNCGCFLGGHHKTGLVFGVNSELFRVFSRGQCKGWGYFFGLLKFQKIGIQNHITSVIYKCI